MENKTYKFVKGNKKGYDARDTLYITDYNLNGIENKLTIIKFDSKGIEQEMKIIKEIN